ncbi:Crp/Fnr family transcriptional regulator [Flavobacteriaceae bacterium 3-367]|uniref:Crp/Fnr family transcriptional regulator n=1 Tax=Eudoraea algarum TaxID=3417568 RepID=UPI003289651A
MHPDLLDYIQRYVDLSEEEIALFVSYLKPRNLKKKEFLLEAGQVCRSRYFIIKGVVRQFYIDKKGNEQIIHFGVDNWWITDYASVINKTVSHCYIEALEDTQMLELSEEDLNRLCVELPKADQLFRKIMEKTYIAIQARLEFMMSLSGEELFQTFISHNPDFVQRVPQYMIASYLGMSPEFVSKIRSRKK